MFEFEDSFEDEADDTLMLRDSNVYIHIENGRFVVSRCCYLGDGVYAWDRCLNWQALEKDLAVSIPDKGDGFKVGQVYPCPEDTAVRAVWSAGYETNVTRLSASSVDGMHYKEPLC
jgi:hypothetical protein